MYSVAKHVCTPNTFIALFDELAVKNWLQMEWQSWNKKEVQWTVKNVEGGIS